MKRIFNGPLTVVPRKAPVIVSVIEITPSPAEYDQLVRDLARLCELGATSNTVAVVEAVHAAVTLKSDPEAVTKKPGGDRTPPARQQEVESCARPQ